MAPLATDLRQAQSDPAAFGKVYRAQAQAMLVFFARRTFDAEVALDLTAETFAQAFEHRRGYRGTTEDEAVGWLYAIARHQLHRYFRRGVAERKAVERLGISMPSIADDDYQRIIDVAGLGALRGRVSTALASLSPNQRDALHLRIVDERSYAAVAAALGVSEPTARARVSRALQRLADATDLSTPTEATK